MKRSLSRRLLGILFTVILTAWIATAYFSYLDARYKINEVLDANLAQSASLLRGLMDRADYEAEPFIASQADAGGIAFRARNPAGRTVLRSSHFPDLPENIADGYADVAVGDIRWRVFSDRGGATGELVQVAERYGPRVELAASVANHLLHPVWIALPILAGLIWLSVKWGLAPLLSLAQQVKQRDPGKLELLDEHETPQETQSLLRALNSLFARVTELQDRERRFTADAAHELRTPLAAIRTHAEVAQAAQHEGERSRAIDNVLKGTDRAAHLVDQLLLLGRLEAQGVPLSLTRVSLAEIATRAIADQVPAAAVKGIDLGLAEVEADEVIVLGNFDLLLIMARNLVDNAIRYSHEGGIVRVSVKGGAQGVSLAVADNGPGLPPHERERVFDRFYRGLGTGQVGSGLGLSIVARIAELHGARIGLDAGIGGCGLTLTATFAAPALSRP